MVLLLSVIFIFALIGCSNDQPKQIKSQPVEKHVDNSISMEDNMKELADGIQEFKAQLSAEQLSKEKLQEAVNQIRETVKEGINANYNDQYKDILSEWETLTNNSPFDDKNITKDQIGEWIDNYNALIEKTYAYIMDKAKK